MRWVALLFALVGCDSVFGLDTPKLHDGGEGSGGSDAGAGCTNIGRYGDNNGGWITTCVASDATDVTLDAQTLDTTGDPRCGSDMNRCLIVAHTLTIRGEVRAVGDRPLVLVASAAIKIDAVLDVSSAPDGVGPGASAAPCMLAPAGLSTLNGGGGGGAGASWQTHGGNGGDSTMGTFVIALPPENPPTSLRAGCRGGGGGSGTGTTPSAGGFGGGAVYLAAPVITLSTGGAIDARGQGGDGGGGTIAGSGGAGGGTGGLIVFDTMTFAFPGSGGALNANGGGGGAGGGGGGPGQSGHASSTPSMPGSGGTGPSGSSGGPGASGNGNGLPGVASGTQSTAGGGGGGGQGFILLFTRGGATFSDPARVSPDLLLP